MYLGQEERSTSEILRERAAARAAAAPAARARVSELVARAWVTATFPAIVGRAPTGEESQSITNSLRIGAWSYDDARRAMQAIAAGEPGGAGGMAAEGAAGWGWAPWLIGGAALVGGVFLFGPRRRGR